MSLRELTTAELFFVSGGEGEGGGGDSGTGSDGTGSNASAGANGGSCDANDPNGLGVGYSVADSNLAENSPSMNFGIEDFINGFTPCQLGLMGGAVAGAPSGPGGVAAGTLGGGIAGGCFGGGGNDSH